MVGARRGVAGRPPSKSDRTRHEHGTCAQARAFERQTQRSNAGPRKRAAAAPGSGYILSESLLRHSPPFRLRSVSSCHVGGLDSFAAVPEDDPSAPADAEGARSLCPLAAGLPTPRPSAKSSPKPKWEYRASPDGETVSEPTATPLMRISDGQ